MGEKPYMPINMDSIIVDSPQLVNNGTFEYEDESYFLQTYVPLSNFPTPPPSTSDGGTRPSSVSYEGFSDEDCFLLGMRLPARCVLQALLTLFFVGPSIYLSNLIPTTVSYLDPSPSLVLSILKRAKLPIEILALAVCILDSLNSRFANVWRRSYPLSIPSQNTSYTFTSPNHIPHIDSVRPEIVIISALILAQKFLDDEQSPTSLWAEHIGEYRWSAEQINATEFSIMDNLQWRLLPLWTEDRLAEALEDMEMAGRQAQALQMRQARKGLNNKGLVESSMAGNRDASLSKKGSMIFGTGGQAIQCEQTKLWTPIDTPTETPSLDNGSSHLSLETRFAFGASAHDQELLSPRSYTREPFPTYTDPMGGD